jgi:hypothetical protein
MGWYRFFLMLSLAVAMGENCLQAASLPNFSGTWKLDLDAPEATSLEEIMAAQGVPWPKRKAMDTLPMTQVITQTRKTVTIRIETVMGVQTEILKLDGSTSIRHAKEGIGKVESRSHWDKNGTALATVSKFVTPDGHPAEWTVWRYLQDDGRTLVVDHQFSLDDGRKLTAKRVLRKQ